MHVYRFHEMNELQKMFDYRLIQNLLKRQHLLQCILQILNICFSQSLFTIWFSFRTRAKVDIYIYLYILYFGMNVLTLERLAVFQRSLREVQKSEVCVKTCENYVKCYSQITLVPNLDTMLYLHYKSFFGRNIFHPTQPTQISWTLIFFSLFHSTRDNRFFLKMIYNKVLLHLWSERL